MSASIPNSVLTDPTYWGALGQALGIGSMVPGGGGIGQGTAATVVPPAVKTVNAAQQAIPNWINGLTENVLIGLLGVACIVIGLIAIADVSGASDTVVNVAKTASKAAVVAG